MDLAAPDAHRIARTHLTILTLDRKRAHALDPIHSLLEAVVAVRGRHLGVGRDGALEYRDAPARIVSVNEKINLHCTDLDDA